jgi:hypothetical protein
MKNKIFLNSVLLVTLGLFAFLSLNTNQSNLYKPRVEKLSGKTQSWHNALAYYSLVKANQVTGEISAQDVLAARKSVEEKTMQRSGSLGLSWQEVGPDNVGGRTRAILIDKDDNKKLFCGGVSGGLFMSTNQAASWQRVEGFYENLIVASIAQGPNGEIYVGTGSDFDGPSGGGGSGFLGRGVYKSVDGGITWTRLLSASPSANNNQTGPEWVTVNAIEVDQNNGTVYAAMNRGLRMSTDGGETWTNPVFLDENCTFANTGQGQDVVVKNDGGVVAVISGRIVISDNPTEPCSFKEKTGSGFPSGQRTEITLHPTDNDYLYSISSSGGEVNAINRSIDGGHTWTLLQSPIAGYFGGDGGLCNGQCYYDLTIGVNPFNKEDIIIGGVQLWRWNGNLTRIAVEFPGPGTFQYYVHSDKHAVVFDKTEQNIVYIGTDGGVAKSVDGGKTYFEANRGLNIYQIYGLGFDSDGKVMAGSQDNGTKEMTGKGGQTPLEGTNILGGDGYDCDYSNINDVYFASIYYQALYRGVDGAGAGPFCVPSGCPDISEGPIGSFYTKVRLWETLNDPYSKSKIRFENVNEKQGIQKGNNVKRNFSATVEKQQEASKLMPGTVKVYAGVPGTSTYQEVIDSATTSTSGVFIGDGNGTVNYITGEFSVNFDYAPKTTETIWVDFGIKYNAGDVLYFNSESSTTAVKIPIKYTLPYNLLPGDVIEVQDPVQSWVAANDLSGVSITRDGLKLSKTAQWFKVPNVVGSFVHSLEFSSDGNHLFVGGDNGQLWRVSNLREVYTLADLTSKATITRIGSFGQVVTGIAVDPNNADHVIVTLGNYGNNNYVYRSTTATTAPSATGVGSFTSIQGDLPKMPVYDAIVDINNSGRILIGTEYGMWGTDNINGSSTSWSDENAEMGYVPVFDVRQQTNPFSMTPHKGMVYVGTHGRGAWKSASLTSIKTPEVIASGDGFVSKLKVYPNPMSSNGTISFELNNSAEGKITIFDLNGRAVKTISKKAYQAGNNIVDINIDELQPGTYVTTLEVENEKKVAKFVVL